MISDIAIQFYVLEKSQTFISRMEKRNLGDQDSVRYIKAT